MSVVCRTAQGRVHAGWWCYVEAHACEPGEGANGARRRRQVASCAGESAADALLPELRQVAAPRLRWRRFEDVEQVMRWLSTELRVQLQDLEVWDRWFGYRWLCHGQQETRQRLGAGEEFALPVRLRTPFGVARVRWTVRPVLFLHPPPDLLVCHPTREVVPAVARAAGSLGPAASAGPRAPRASPAVPER